MGFGWKPANYDAYKKTLDEKLELVRGQLALEELSVTIEDKLELLEGLVKETAAACKVMESSLDGSKLVLDGQTQMLIDRRKLLAPGGPGADLRRQLSKQIQEQMRKQLRKHKREQIQERLFDFRNIKSISGVRARRQKHMLQSVLDPTGNLHEDRQEIVDVFADFYGKLYSSLRIPAHSIPNLFGEEQVGDITREEVRAVFQKMRKGKAADKSGLTLEMFLHGSEDLVQMIAALFTAILRLDALPPKV